MARSAQSREAKPVLRCSWCGTDPVYVAYHDDEWGVPERDSPRIVREAAARRLPGRAFLDHHPAQARGVPRRLRRVRSGKIARYGPAERERLMDDSGIVRNRAKIEASVGNASAYLAIEEKQGFALICGVSSTASRSRTRFAAPARFRPRRRWREASPRT